MPNTSSSKLALVTGANAGLGRITALELARQGYEVVLLCRNRAKGEAAVADIQRKTRNERLHLIQCDLSSQADIRRAAAQIRARFPVLDVLVNNAGGLNGAYVETVDGLETTLAVNHLSVFLLTNLLLDSLKAAPAGRIVVLSSQAQAMGKIPWDNLNLKNDYSAWGAYCNSKLMNLLFAFALARRLKGTAVTVNAVHPGAVRTNFGRTDGGFAGTLFRLFSWTMRSPEKGAETSIWLATSPDVAGVTGRYFSDRKPITAQSLASDEAAQERLWQVSNELTESQFV
jgi:NAD(P)-dependent dehydrogenase (short-subunit alcohol dehydrogenase family)